MINLEDNETKLFEVRRHPLLFIIPVFFLAILAVAPLILAFIVTQLFPEIGAPETNIVYLLLVAYVLWLMIIWMLVFVQWTNYYLDVWIITNKRIIDFEFKGFFNYETTSLRFDRIQDVTIEVSGILGNIFHFGTVHVETAGEKSDTFIIRDAASPNTVKENILKQYNLLLDRNNPSSGV